MRQIEEGISPKAAIVTVTAEDPDSGDNGKIKYTISHQEPVGQHFAIEEESGVIFTLRDIDREFSDKFHLTVVATDQAEPHTARLSAEKLVTVIVEDINDNAPLFVSMNAGLLPENSIEGYEIMNVSARDSDALSNGQVTYELVGGQTDLFDLNRITGSLRLKRDIPVPDIAYRITVRATDEAVQAERQSSEAYITILGMSSQEGPQFKEKSYSGSVYESSNIGTSVAAVSARLSSSTSNIDYYVVNVTDSNGVPTDRMFNVQGGLLVTAAVLDREEGPNSYIVTIAAVVTKGDTPKISMTQVSNLFFKSSVVSY